jgi:hypothetical protein
LLRSRRRFSLIHGIIDDPADTAASGGRAGILNLDHRSAASSVTRSRRFMSLTSTTLTRVCGA